MAKSELQLYHEYVQTKFRRSWKPSATGRPVRVQFFVGADGAITSVTVHDTSGNVERNEAALAFVRAQKLKPLPEILAQRLGSIQIDYLF